MSMQAALVRAILEKHESYQWTVQGFGMLRTKIADIGRIHIWDSRLATPLVSTMHTHPWPLKSTVISGELINQRFNEHKAGSLKYMRAVIKCGEGGGLAGEPPTEVRLISMPPETYLAGSTYEQRPNEIHRSIPQDGTVTLMERPQGMEDAMVYWPIGTQWVSAEPQPIEGWKLQQAVSYALSRWDTASAEVQHSDACKIRNLARPSSCDSECSPVQREVGK